MKRTILFFSVVILISALSSQVLANSAPVVSNVTAAQRSDDSKLVDIHYDLADADGDNCTVWVVVSDNNGVSWRVPARTFTGDIGASIAPGLSKLIVWDAGADMPGKVGDFKVRVYADDGKVPWALVLVPGGMFPYQNGDPCFVESFMIDKYEVTVQQYCQFLNGADPNGEHWTTDMEIDRYGDPCNYYYTVHSGRENYPIRYVNFYNASAFADWRSQVEGMSYRLPTEQEWEKAAAWDPVEQHYYLYGFHRDSIDTSWCNYNNFYEGPLPVGSFNGTGGKEDAKSYYGCYDMSGNLWEWTSSIYSGSNRVKRGGAWNHVADYCRTSVRIPYSPSNRYSSVGFRLVLDL
jgi:hypothetical protein